MESVVLFQLIDYANRQFAGLMKFYYKPRWQLYFTRLNQSLFSVSHAKLLNSKKKLQKLLNYLLLLSLVGIYSHQAFAVCDAADTFSTRIKRILLVYFIPDANRNQGYSTRRRRAFCWLRQSSLRHYDGIHGNVIVSYFLFIVSG